MRVRNGVDIVNGTLTAATGPIVTKCQATEFRIVLPVPMCMAFLCALRDEIHHCIPAAREVLIRAMGSEAEFVVMKVA